MSFHIQSGAQIVVLTPYLAQLMELRDALDGSISDQDARDLAFAIKQSHRGAGCGGQHGDFQGKQGCGDTVGADTKPKVRVSTGELSRFSLLLYCLSSKGTRFLPEAA